MGLRQWLLHGKPTPEREQLLDATTQAPDRIHVAFDEHRPVANVGLLLPATLVLRLVVRELVDQHVDLGYAPRPGQPQRQADDPGGLGAGRRRCINDADALRSGSTGRVMGCVVKAPSTLGTFLRSFRWGHVRQLDWVSRELLA